MELKVTEPNTEIDCWDMLRNLDQDILVVEIALAKIRRRHGEILDKHYATFELVKLNN